MAKITGKNAQRISVSNAQNLFAEDEQERKGMRSEARKVLILGIIFFIILIFAMILPTQMFTYSLVDYTPAVFLDTLTTNFNNLLGVFVGNGALFENRFMLVIVCAIGGAALGLCGSTYQGAFNNPLAAPKTLGVMSGGALGALVWVLWFQQFTPKMSWDGVIKQSEIAAGYSQLGIGDWIIVNYGRCLCSIVGCFIVVGIVILITSFVGRGKLSNIVVIVGGQIFGAAVSAIIAFARYYFTQDGDFDMATQLAEIENYTMIYDYYYRDLLIIVLPIAICIIITLLLRNRLTLLSFGDEVARTMGVNVNRSRYGIIALCTLMTALAISFCGHVAFLGFISAHIARKIVGSNFNYLLPASVFVGGGLLLIIQWICQSGLPYTSIYCAGAVSSILGACIFLVMAFKQAREGISDWR